MKTLSFEEALAPSQNGTSAPSPTLEYDPAKGAFSSSRASPKPAPKAPTLTFEEGLVGPQKVLERQLQNEAMVTSVLDGAKNLGGSAAVLADMILGLPGFAVSVGENLGAQLYAMGAGETPKGAAQAGRAAMEHGLGAKLSSPLHKLMMLFKSGKIYEESSGAKGMEKVMSLVESAGKEVERITKGAVPAEQVMTLTDTLMLGVGMRGGDIAVEWARAKRKGPESKEQTPSDAVLGAESADIRANLEAAIRLPEQSTQAHINSLLGIRSATERKAAHRRRQKELQDAFTKESWKDLAPDEPVPPNTITRFDPKTGLRQVAESGPDVAEYLAARANESFRNHRAYDSALAQAEAAELAAAQARQMPLEAPASAREARARAREQAYAEQYYGERKPTLEQMIEIQQKAPELRTRDDLMNIRAWNRQRGSVDPEFLVWAGAGAVGTAVGILAAKEFVETDLFKGTIAPWVRRKLGLDVDEPLERKPEPSPTREGTFLAAGPDLEKLAPLGVAPFAAMAVKGKGGMWHPEAVERLASPLEHKLSGFDRTAVADNIQDGVELRPGVREAHEWTSRAIRNYLNKYAGTKEDPLKDVEIPFGEGVKRWEEVTDKAIRGRTAEDIAFDNNVRDPLNLDPNHPYYSYANQMMRPGERIWDVPRMGLDSADTALTSYLSHVGDYLRQNVPPEKLSQYDLVRAVKETAAWDKKMAEQAKKLESAHDAWNLKQMETMPVYKDYGDGFKWVQLTRPGEFAHESTVMGHSVRGYEPPKGKHPDWIPESEYGLPKYQEMSGYSHYGVGGWEAIKSGDARIYSLRGPDGKSHVTVEVGKRFEAGAELPWTEVNDILQIKGKQNRAPADAYLPYVQDFVKSGKWGDVGDLRNTGLWRAQDGRYYTRAEVEANEALTNEYAGRNVHQGRVYDDPGFGPRNQQGFMDLQTLGAISAIGLGGLIGSQLADEHPYRGALIGALAGAFIGLPGGKARLANIAEKADQGLGVLSTRIRNISEPVRLAAVRFEKDNLTRAYEELRKGLPFLAGLNSMPAAARAKLERAIFTDADAATKLIEQTGNKSFIESWKQTRQVLSTLGAESQTLGRFRKMTEGYFPRMVVDKDGLFAALGKPDEARIQKALREANEEALRVRGSELTPIEESMVINEQIRQFYREPKGKQSDFFKPRSIEQITETLQPFYATPAESFYAYVRGTVQDLEMAKFFGRNVVHKKALGGGNFIDVDASVGNLVGQELRAGRITEVQADQLIEMLKSRFKGGERAPNAFVREARNIANLGLLGNFVSAVTQLGDLPVVLYAQGLRSTLAAVTMKLSGKEKITARDLGLADHIAEELVHGSRGKHKWIDTALWVNKVFRHTIGAVDRPIKDIALNAAVNRYERLAQTPKGVEQIRQKYGDAFGADFAKLIEDLKAKRRSSDVDTLAFAELSDLQPISKVEVPQAYLNNPNWRLAYMLKTFAIKQADIVRRESYNKIKEGKIAEGLRNLMSYSFILGIGGATSQMIKDWIMGRPVDFGAEEIAENVLKTFGMGEYVRDKVAQGKPIQGVANVVLPPWQVFEQLVTADPKAVQYIPYVGKIIYNQAMGGAEKYEVQKALKEKKETGTMPPLSPEAQEYLRKQREERRLKRLLGKE